MKRVKILLYKLFGIKGFVWQVGTVSMWYGKISGAEWITLCLIVLGFHTAQKWEGEKGKFNVSGVGNS